MNILGVAPQIHLGKFYDNMTVSKMLYFCSTPHALEELRSNQITDNVHGSRDDGRCFRAF